MAKRSIVTAVVTGALAVWALAGSATAEDASLCDPKAPPANLNFTLKDVNGKSVALAAFKGKVVILNFWATWCIPCRAEIPDLVALQSKYAGKGLQVVGVSIDDTAEKMKPFVGQFKMNYPVLTAFQNEKILDTYGPMVVVPATAVIRRNGTICAQHIGPVSKEKFEKEIVGLL